MGDIPPEFLSQMRAQADPNFVSFAAPEGDYTVVLVVDGKKYTAKTAILPDIFSAK